MVVGTLRPVVVLTAALTIIAMIPTAASAHPPGTTDRVSVRTSDFPGSPGAPPTPGDNDSLLSAISADGRFVAFWSLASNLVPGDTNGTGDVFVHDRVTGTTERVSVSSKGRQAVGADSGGVLDFNAGPPAISADGRYVAFASSATNLVMGDKNNAVDVFLRDRVAGTTERVSVGNGRKPEANADSGRPAISADGRFVTFSSFADNLITADTNFARDVFVRDRSAGTTELVSRTSTGGLGDNESTTSAISADGRYVAFESWEDDVVPGDTNFSFDIFVRDRTTGTVERESVSSAGVQGNDWSLNPSISADGRYVAFQSFADNLVPGDTNSDYDVFVRDRVAGTTVRDSVTSAGDEGGGSLGSTNPSLSANGQEVAFESEAGLVPDDTGFPVDIHVHAEP